MPIAQLKVRLSGGEQPGVEPFYGYIDVYKTRIKYLRSCNRFQAQALIEAMGEVTWINIDINHLVALKD
jgi:hypothetical protein